MTAHCTLIPSLLTPSLLAASRRYLTRHPWQTWLSIIGIALGVAVVIAVDLANESARRGFRLSVEQVTGPATHQIEAASGAIPDAVYAQLRIAHHLERAAPVIDAPIRIDGRSMTLLGIDPIAAAPMRAAVAGAASGDPAGLVRLLGTPDTLALSASDARAPRRPVGDARGRDRGRDRHWGARDDGRRRTAGARRPGPCGARDHRYRHRPGGARAHRRDRAHRPDARRRRGRRAGGGTARGPAAATRGPAQQRAGADDPRLPHQPHRDEPAGDAGGRFHRLQHHDLRGAAAPSRCSARCACSASPARRCSCWC